MIHGLSFDVEEHFHALNLRPVAPADTWEKQERRAANSTRAIMDTLDRHRVKATFFFLGWVAKRDPELVRDAHRRALPRFRSLAPARDRGLRPGLRLRRALPASGRGGGDLRLVRRVLEAAASKFKQ